MTSLGIPEEYLKTLVALFNFPGYCHDNGIPKRSQIHKVWVLHDIAITYVLVQHSWILPRRHSTEEYQFIQQWIRNLSCSSSEREFLWRCIVSWKHKISSYPFLAFSGLYETSKSHLQQFKVLFSCRRQNPTAWNTMQSNHHLTWNV